jgi:hypothetical protein
VTNAGKIVAEAEEANQNLLKKDSATAKGKS